MRETPQRYFAAAVFVLACAWAAALAQRGLPLAPDEIEFFRATRWIATGEVPYRDFWEHHTPLQWMVFAPVAAVASSGPGVASVTHLRWAQFAAWAAIAALLVRMTRRAGFSAALALLLLVASPSFVRRAVEYRVDVLGNLAFFAATAIGLASPRRRGWIAFGALMSAAVLANMRLVPLVVLAAVLMLIWRQDERRWGLRAEPLWMGAGVAGVVAAFLGYLAATGAMTSFFSGVIGYNRASSQLLQVHTFMDALLAPVWSLDPAGIALLMLGSIGAFAALHEIRKPGIVQIAAILAIGSALAVAMMQVQYDYHFQNFSLLLAIPAALAIARLPREIWRTLVVIVAAAGVFVSVMQTAPAFGTQIDYQNAVMTDADRLTSANEPVLDGAGYALRRAPAYRYWFLTTGVRLLAAQRVLEPYDLRAISSRPPAAVIADYRLQLYLRLFPEVAHYATTHYVPVYRELWVPGMSALVSRETPRVVWHAPRSGRYVVWASAAMATHPWFTQPLQYAAVQGPLAPRYAIPLRRMPPLEDGALRWSVDGVTLPAGSRELDLRAGSRVELISSFAGRAGVMLVPRGIETLCIAPAEEMVF